MAVVTILPDNRIIAKTRDVPRVVPPGGGNVAVAISVSDLKTVEECINVRVVSADPKTTATPQDQKIVGNVVGLTINAAAGTTITTEITTIGF